MPSLIDPSVPVAGNPTTQSVRNNFAVAAGEITALQLAVAEIASPVATIAALRQQTAAEDGSLWLVAGYWQPGDAPMVMYQYAAAAGAPDNGGTVIAPLNGLGRFLAGPALNPNMTNWPGSDTRNWGSTASNLTTTGTIGAGSTALALAAAGDFIVGQPIAVFGAGPAATLAAPTGGAGAPAGTAGAGSTTYYYRVAAIDANNAISPACAEFPVPGCAANLGQPVDLAPNGNALVQLSWTAVPGAVSYIVYGGTASGAEVFIGLSTGASFQDFGPIYYDPAPAWIPPTPSGSAQGGLLRSFVAAGGGTTAVTLGNASISAVANGVVIHDDTAALAAALAALAVVNVAVGTCDIVAGLNLATNNQSVIGNAEFSSIIRAWGQGDLITASADFNTVRNLNLSCTGVCLGRTLFVNGATRCKFYDINVTDSFAGIEITNRASGNFYYHWHWYGSHRAAGGYVLYMHGTDPAPVSLQWFDGWQDVKSARCAGVNIDGNCVSIWLFNISVQAKIAELLIQNTAGSGPPTLIYLFRYATNAMSGNAGVNISAGNNVDIDMCWFQGSRGAGGRGITLTGTTNGVIISNSYIWNADHDGIFIAGTVAGVLVNNCYVYENARSGPGLGYAAININGAAQNINISGGSNLMIGPAAAALASEDYGVAIAATASDVTVSGNWQGTVANIFQQASPGANVVVRDQPTGSPATTLCKVDAATTLTVATYPHLYQGSGGKVAVLDLSGQTAARVFTTDTAANIIAALPTATIGGGFRIRIVNHTNFAHTLAAGAGVTLAGRTTIAANGGGMRNASYADFDATVTAAGAVTLYGVAM